MEVLLDHIFELLLMGFLLLCSAFFSGTETALFSLSREQIKRLRGEGRSVDKMLSLLSGNPLGLLIAILFGNIIVNILFFSSSVVVAGALGRQYGAWWQAATGIVALLLVILCGEILPKAAGISYPERMVRLNSAALRGWFHFMGPLRSFLEYIAKHLEPADQHDDHLSAGELQMLIEATQHDPSLGTQEKVIIEDIVNLPELRIRELMVPRVDQLLLRSDCSIKEALSEAAEEELELVPVYEEDEDHIIGVVELHALFTSTTPDLPIRSLVQPVRFVPETARADIMLREFQEDNLRLACVVNEYGGLAGTVSIEDLFSEVIGEYDAMEIPPIEKLGESTYRLGGQLSIREWRTLFVGFMPDEVVRTLALDTVSGLVVSLLKRLPVDGDTVQVRNLKFTVEQVRNNRIELVILELIDENGGEA